MGFLDFLFSSPDPQVQPVTTTSTQSIPPYIEDPVKRLLPDAETLVKRPYPLYPGQRLSEFDPQETQAFGMVPGTDEQWQPAQARGFEALLRGMGTFPGAASGYMNPYMEGVTDIASREAIRDEDIAASRRGLRAAREGAFGTSRHGIVDAEGERNLGQRLDDIRMKGLAGAFDRAGTLFGADADRALKGGEAFSNLGTAGQSNFLRDIAALEASGKTQRNLGQQNLDVAYGDFKEQRDYPQNQLAWFFNLLKGSPQPTTTTTDTQQIIPQASPLAQAAGLLGAGASAANIFWGK